MEKKEKKADLEQLLNSLIEKGWKPNWKECSHFIMQHDADVLDWKVIYTAVRKDKWVFNIHYTLRDLVGKESWLWQFVCENDMVDKKKIWIYYEMFLEENWIDAKNYRPFSLVERLIIESALKDESELEDFLLNSIKID